MSTPLLPITITYNDCTLTPHLSKDLEKQIRSITASEIEVLAKRVVKLIYQFDLTPEICETLSTNFKTKITEAFSTPQSFIEKGLDLILLDNNNKGILDQTFDPSLKFYAPRAKEEIKKAQNLKTLTLKMNLSVNRDLYDQGDDIRYNIRTYQNDTCVSFSETTIEKLMDQWLDRVV